MWYNVRLDGELCIAARSAIGEGALETQAVAFCYVALLAISWFESEIYYASEGEVTRNTFFVELLHEKISADRWQNAACDAL